ncbi:MAG: adenosylcobinamide kinase [Epsilonproteobacteria bacterium]|nr:MAG: adenosylcobinamide kinase [Campylobacterota bacterium]
MKALFIGGVKSGKSLNAEQYILALPAEKRPYYLATNELLDEEMKMRIKAHREQRSKRFITIEEPMHLYETLRKLDAPVLVECTTMWINNMLYYNLGREQILEHIDRVLTLPQTIVFVHNDVGTGIIPDNALARQYIDISGVVSQKIARRCDDVFHCIAGIATKIK